MRLNDFGYSCYICDVIKARDQCKHFSFFSYFLNLYFSDTNIVSGLLYLHGCKSIHEDIKPENVLISVHSDNLTAKISAMANINKFSNNYNLVSTFYSSVSCIDESNFIARPDQDLQIVQPSRGFDIVAARVRSTVPRNFSMTSSLLQFLKNSHVLIACSSNLSWQANGLIIKCNNPTFAMDMFSFGCVLSLVVIIYLDLLQTSRNT
ncbi:unnamed protein product, partial [Arabidopsis halleri]